MTVDYSVADNIRKHVRKDRLHITCNFYFSHNISVLFCQNNVSNLFKQIFSRQTTLNSFPHTKISAADDFENNVNNLGTL